MGAKHFIVTLHTSLLLRQSVVVLDFYFWDEIWAVSGFGRMELRLRVFLTEGQGLRSYLFDLRINSAVGAQLWGQNALLQELLRRVLEAKHVARRFFL